MSEFKIEKGLPVIMGKRGKKPKYPFGAMEIGDSFFVADDDEGKAVSRARVTAHTFSNRHSEYKFTCSKLDGGLRIWRVKP